LTAQTSSIALWRDSALPSQATLRLQPPGKAAADGSPVSQLIDLAGRQRGFALTICDD